MDGGSQHQCERRLGPGEDGKSSGRAHKTNFCPLSYMCTMRKRSLE